MALFGNLRRLVLLFSVVGVKASEFIDIKILAVHCKGDQYHVIYSPSSSLRRTSTQELCSPSCKISGEDCSNPRDPSLFGVTSLGGVISFCVQSSDVNSGDAHPSCFDVQSDQSYITVAGVHQDGSGRTQADLPCSTRSWDSPELTCTLLG